MPLNFPEVSDIHLKNAPLREVICQVRFPTILRIAHEEPVDFQERIRGRFPALDVEQNVNVIVEADGAGREGAQQRVMVRPVYRFHDQDKVYMVTLNIDSYALSTENYSHWTGFSEALAYVADAFQAVYQIPYATRIGLRYVNTLGVGTTGVESFADVLDLIRDELTVMLKIDAIQAPETAMQQIRIANNGDQLIFRHGLIREGSPAEPMFALDFDHFIEGEIGLDDLLSRCDRYHRGIYSAFRWCIADGKLGVFQPIHETTEET